MRSLSLLLVVASCPLTWADTPGRLVLVPGKERTLVNPACSHCKDEARRRKDDLRPDDRVLCWIRGKYDGGAIPFRFFLYAYPVISDTYGVFVLDHDAGFARAFAPSLDFTLHGWRNGVQVIRHKDGTLFSSLTGIAFAGKRKDERLSPVPTLQCDWGPWVSRYPDTVAFHLFPRYAALPAPGPGKASLESRGKVDPRLPAEERVFGLSVGRETRAYPFAKLRRSHILRDRLGGEDVILLHQESTRTVAAFAPIASPPSPGPKPRVLTLEAEGKREGWFKDRETGSSWDVTGRCATGMLRGWTLKWLDGVEVKWFAWSAEYPRTSIQGDRSPGRR